MKTNLVHSLLTASAPRFLTRLAAFEKTANSEVTSVWRFLDQSRNVLRTALQRIEALEAEGVRLREFDEESINLLFGVDSAEVLSLTSELIKVNGAKVFAEYRFKLTGRSYGIGRICEPRRIWTDSPVIAHFGNNWNEFDI